jgi:hypothetical protein
MFHTSKKQSWQKQTFPNSLNRKDFEKGKFLLAPNFGIREIEFFFVLKFLGVTNLPPLNKNLVPRFKKS